MKRIYTPARAKKILIVDDDDVVASIYADALREEGFDVEIASDRKSALQKIKDSSVGLVILDLSLLKIDGVEILKSIRAHPATETLPMIIFSNVYVSHALEERLKTGATKWVNRGDCALRCMNLIVQELLPGSASNKTLSEQSQVEQEKKLTMEFFVSTRQRIGKLRAAHHEFTSVEKDNARRTRLFEIHRQTRFLLSVAAVAGFRRIAQYVIALEALLSELHARPKRITDSTTRTIAQAIDLLALVLEHAADFETEESVSPTILVVDDEIISRQAICSALERAGLAPVCEGDPIMAEKLLDQTHFDLIFLDVNMPGESGWDLCDKVRKRAANRTTPVVFVTAHSDLACRAQSSLSGGNDFIAKPFLSVELALKALTWLFGETARAFSRAASYGNNINQQQMAEAVLEQDSYENKTKRSHAVVS